eukprot:CAMPEP_0181321032 /NCGR_PEP_ID=MMETSP1101-20121128/18451_1 /TAXON_ID=46948 /ORGANISM="Rhodomonas abbreviata, Strain Caron Lab Isolate" /LENGTH=124 /DNA_ID=CAMNT_0023428797 /DNA_START=2473 /DNA_END=2847 /DNA_ORIENTATION=-
MRILALRQSFSITLGTAPLGLPTIPASPRGMVASSALTRAEGPALATAASLPVVNPMGGSGVAGIARGMPPIPSRSPPLGLVALVAFVVAGVESYKISGLVVGDFAFLTFHPQVSIIIFREIFR